VRYLIFGLFFTLGLPLKVGASDVTLSKDFLVQKYGVDFRGILYICDPYCRFLSLREDDSWNPNPEGQTVNEQRITVVRQSDPEYPLLIKRFPVYPYLRKNPKGEEDLSNLTAYERQLIREGQSWVSEYQLGLYTSMMDVKSDSQLQSDFEPEGWQSGWSAKLDMRRIRWTKLWRLRWKNLLHLGYSSSFSGKLKNSKDLNTQSMNLAFNFILPYNSERWGILTQVRQKKATLSGDDLSSFGYSELLGFLGLGYYRESLRLQLLTNFFSSMKDSQGFRTAPYEQSVYVLDVETCTRDITIFDFSTSYCFAYQGEWNQQKSAVANNIISGSDNVKMTTLSHMFFITMRFGERMWQ